MRETDPDALLTFRETPLFMNRIAKLAGEDAIDVLFAVQQELLNDPKGYLEGKHLLGAKERAASLWKSHYALKRLSARGGESHPAQDVLAARI